jgi:hypothetical protein
MMNSFNKRGQEDKLYFLIWELIALAMVAIVILVSVRSVATGSGYFKRYYSTDLALMADLANTNRGDFTINYALKEQNKNAWTKMYLVDGKRFEISLDNDSVMVYDYPKENIVTPSTYPYAKNKGVYALGSDVISDFVILQKMGPQLSIEQTGVGSLDECSSMQPLDTHMDESNLDFNSFSLDDQTKPYADSINTMIKNFDTTRKKSPASTIIVGHSSKFIIYYSDDSRSLMSKKLACVLSRQYSGYPGATATANVMAYDKSLDSNIGFSKYINAPKGENEVWIAIMVSDDVMNTKNIDKARFGAIIKKAIDEYYG